MGFVWLPEKRVKTTLYSPVYIENKVVVTLKGRLLETQPIWGNRVLVEKRAMMIPSGIVAMEVDNSAMIIAIRICLLSCALLDAVSFGLARLLKRIGCCTV